MTATVPLVIEARFRPHPKMGSSNDGEEIMKLTELLLAGLEREAAFTRIALQRIPEGHNDWKPHPTSVALGYLASLIATLPAWIATMVNQNEVDLKSPGAARLKAPEWTTRAELMTALDANISQARDALANTTDEHLLAPWRFLVGSHVVDESPRHVMIADSVFSHLAHHRGQLTVYLRLRLQQDDAQVPALCGPSADQGLVA